MKVKDIVKTIKQNRSSFGDERRYDTKSAKDELTVMKAMLNDQTYQVDIYSSEGKVGTYNPAKSFRGMLSSVISDTTGIPRIEADNLLNNYEIKTSEAKSVLDFSKEYINTYLHTGRKLPLGGREKSNVSLIEKTIPAGYVRYPVKVGEDPDGRAICESKEAFVGEYKTVKVYGPCPYWLKNDNK